MNSSRIVRAAACVILVATFWGAPDASAADRVVTTGGPVDGTKK